MDRKLLDILVCPASRQPLSMMNKAEIEALNGAIRAGGLTCIDDTPQTDAIQAGLITQDRKTIYRIDDGIPVLLIDEGIASARVEGFPTQ